MRLPMAQPELLHLGRQRLGLLEGTDAARAPRDHHAVGGLRAVQRAAHHRQTLSATEQRQRARILRHHHHRRAFGRRSGH